MSSATPEAEPESSVLVWGAGAIGGTVAAYLARAGVRVHAVDADEAHVRAVREGGLRITGPIDAFDQQLAIDTPEAVTGTWHTVFLCTKALHTASAAAALGPRLAPGGVVVSLQNGLNELVIADAVGRDRTMGAFVNFGADRMEPGVVHFGGRGAVVVGELDGRPSARLDRVVALLRHFEPAAVPTDNIWGYLWGKMGYGALLFAGALTNASIVEALEAEDVRGVLTDLAREVMSVAAAEGVTPMGFNGYDPAAFLPRGTDAAVAASFEAMAAFNRGSAKTHSGVWRDIAVHQRQTETDAQFGPVIAVADRHGVAVPTLRRLVARMHDVESGRRPLAWDNLASLAEPDPEGAQHAHPLR